MGDVPYGELQMVQGGGKEEETQDSADLARRVEELEKDSRRKWQYVTSMRSEFRERLTGIETTLKHLCHRFDRYEDGRAHRDVNERRNYSPQQNFSEDQDRRFERVWGGLQLAAWVVLIAATSGAVLAIVNYLLTGNGGGG